VTNETDKKTAAAVLAEVTRGDVVESVHRGAVVVVDVKGSLVALAGNVDQLTYFRSAAKPFQAIPVVESGAAEAFEFTERELALSCSSHDSTPDHQRGVARMLDKIGLHEDDLRCGISPIADEKEQARSVLGLVWPSQLQCECSGEHAGMLAACKQLGYPLDTYVERNHPLQRRILEIVAMVLDMDEDELILGTDGCSIPTFAAPVRRFASAYATLACPQQSPIANDAGLVEAVDRLRDAMVAYPVMIGNEGVLDTEIMQATGGRIVAKLGAEGLLCLAAPERGWGIAITSDDGMPRGLGPAAIRTLEQLELADDRDLCGLREQFAGAVPSFKGEPVGAVRPALQLQFA
jgi:L-asparaginase II